jgi:hypothetical protein
LIKAETGATVDLEDKTTVSGTVTFEGGGTFVLDPGVASIVGGSAGGTLDIAVGATLAGSGNIGNAGTPSATALTLDNNGTIDANVDGCTLTIHTGNIVTNAGTLEATNGGTLQIDDSVDNESTGVILATGTGSTVSLTFNGGGVNNSGMEEAVAGGTLNLTDDSGGVGNNSGGTIKADAGTVSITGGVDNDGMIKAVDGGRSPSLSTIPTTTMAASEISARSKRMTGRSPSSPPCPTPSCSIRGTARSRPSTAASSR